MSNDTNNSYLVAGAIIIAGALIAFGIFFSQDKPAVDTVNNDEDKAVNREIDIAPITKNDHIIGNLGAKITIVEYSDTECPFCKSFHATLEQITETYSANDVAWVYRHFPLTSIHPKAPREAHATECAGELGGNDGFWNYIKRLYEITPSNNGLDLSVLPTIAEEVGLDKDAFEACQDSEKYLDLISGQFQDAVQSGGTGTPYNVFVLSKKMSSTAQAGINTKSAQFPAGSIRISNDNMRIGISGGLGFNATKEILDIMLDK